jgi:hypothetical protein
MWPTSRDSSSAPLPLLSSKSLVRRAASTAAVNSRILQLIVRTAVIKVCSRQTPAYITENNDVTWRFAVEVIERLPHFCTAVLSWRLCSAAAICSSHTVRRFSRQQALAVKCCCSCCHTAAALTQLQSSIHTLKHPGSFRAQCCVPCFHDIFKRKQMVCSSCICFCLCSMPEKDIAQRHRRNASDDVTNISM